MLRSILLCVGLILYIIYELVKKKYSYFTKLKILHETPKFPWGNMKSVGQKIHIALKLDQLYENYRNKDFLYGFYILLSPIYVITDLNLIKNILVIDFEKFHDRGVYINEKDPLSENLVSLSGEKWKIMKSKLSSSFSMQKIKEMFPKILEHSEKLVKFIENNQLKSIDIKNVAIRYTADVIGTCAFGIDCNALIEDSNETFEILRKTKEMPTSRYLTIFFTMSFPRLSKFLNLKINSQQTIDYFVGVTRATVKYREENNIKINDFLNSLIELRNEGTMLSYEEMAAQAFVFFLAGFDTTMTTMTWCLYELAENEEIQEKVRKEVRQVSKSCGGKFNFEAIHEMRYLEQVINETLRKYSTITTLIRQANEDYRINDSNHVIKKGSQVFIPVYSIHNDPNYYPNPQKFDPDRFSAANSKTRNPLTFLPFGDGPRACTGFQFGILQLKLGIAKLLLNYKFKVNEKTQRPIEFDARITTLSAVGGIWLDAEKMA